MKYTEVSLQPDSIEANTFAEQYSGYTADGSKWSGGLNEATAPEYDHGKLLQRVRRAMLDSTPGSAMVSRRVDTIVGKGLFLSAAPMDALLPITSEQASEWASVVDARFHAFMSRLAFSSTGNMTGYQVQRLVSRAFERDNEWFIRVHRAKGVRGAKRLSFQLIDPTQVGGYSTTNAGDRTADLQSGVIVDSKGQEVAYEIRGNDGKVRRVPRVYRGKLQILHGFVPDYAGQTRGIPRLTPVLQDLKALQDFTLSTVQKAINQATFVATVESGTENPASNVLPVATATATTTTQSSTASRYVETQVIPEFAQGAPGSMVITGLQGKEKLVPFKDTSPSETYNNFVEAFLAPVTAAGGVPYETLLMKFGENYSASRGALALLWRLAEIARQELHQQFMQVVYELFLEEEIAAGYIAAPGILVPELRQAWTNSRLRGSGMPEIDPLKANKATELAVAMNLTSIVDEAFEYNSSSWERNAAQNTDAFSRMGGKPPWQGA